VSAATKPADPSGLGLTSKKLQALAAASNVKL